MTEQEELDKIKNIKQHYLDKIKELRFRGQKEIALLQIKEGGYSAMVNKKEALLDDEEIALAIVMKEGKNLRLLSQKMQNNKKVVLEAVKEDYSALGYASDELKNDPEVVLGAIRCEYPMSFFALQYASPELRDDKKIVLEALEKQWENYRGEGLHYIGKKLSEEILALSIQHLKQK